MQPRTKNWCAGEGPCKGIGNARGRDEQPAEASAGGCTPTKYSSPANSGSTVITATRPGGARRRARTVEQQQQEAGGGHADLRRPWNGGREAALAPWLL
ncbi:hypothetical protein ZWY2020_050216 [Hordeum vulgare]|nr:hypothetical protein ZWY2020_050216 [Hordeum vulgare]